MDVWHLRRDLTFVRVPATENGSAYWVVQDPLARECHYLSDDEKNLLEMADGSAGILSTCRRALDRFTNAASLQAVVEFFVHARRRGLLTATSVGPLETALRQSATATDRNPLDLSRWLAIRFPGWNPERLLRTIEPAFSLFATRQALGCIALLLPLACVIVIGRFDQLVAEAGSVFDISAAECWFHTLVVIAVVKTLHELAHAMMCRHVGAECRQIGIMLLCGTPCLYCDVTALWTVPQKWKRVLVSAAGILAEFLIAAIATIVWAMTGETMLHSLALIVMLVCSVSTLVINANPLLRYDGYFMLADALGIPNFACVARDRFRSVARRIVWGVNEPSRLTLVGRRLSGGWLVGYAVFSGCYRVFVLSCIVAAAFHLAVSNGLEWFMLPVLCILGLLFFFRSLEPFTASPRTLNENGETVVGPRWFQHRRASLMIGVTVLAAAVLMFVPFPRKLRLPVILASKDSVEVFVTRSGNVKRFVTSQNVETGMTLMELGDRDLQDKLLEAQRSLAEAEAMVDSLRLQKSRSESNAEQIAFAEQRLIAARMELHPLAKIADQLHLAAPTSGRFTLSEFTPPLEPGQSIAAGTLIGRIGDGVEREGYAVALPHQLGVLRTGQSASLRHPSIRSNEFLGRVRRISATPRDSVPREIASSIGQRFERPTYYSIEIEWDRGASRIPLPTRSLGIAEIDVGWSSLWGRLRLWFAREFSIAG